MNRVKIFFTFGLLLLVLAVSQFTTACSKPPENPFQAEIDELWAQYDNDPAMLDYVMMAVHLDISVEEAQRREEIEDSFRGLGSRLEAEEPETFGGLWLQQQQPFRVVVAFTRDGEETLTRYISKEQMQYVLVLEVAYSYAELRHFHDIVAHALREREVLFNYWTDVMNNKVCFRVADRTAIDEAVAAGTLTIPEAVEIRVGPLVTPD